ncbi:MAG: 4-hydroxyphenylacetate decarboxylase small subunit [Bacteroidales bacterium]|nr:4-hydroxyphenylacetate decarboxylase small subunit [Bacteroidales bacterium]MCF8388496.1 4-hydroxyphenylacetate decarboxylase small subunit [Bacteroidales bacterium]
MKHYDCKYYLSLDVFKGICKRDKSNILADDPACEHFEKAQKCKHCKNFSSNGEDLGYCMNLYDAYPEMNALSCNDFKQN